VLSQEGDFFGSECELEVVKNRAGYGANGLKLFCIEVVGSQGRRKKKNYKKMVH
jgi:hypothetical protein